MKKCSDCQGAMKELTSKTPEGVDYNYFQCSKCGEEIVDMDQLRKVAAEYRTMKNFHLKISKWGSSLGIRIPKEVAKRYGLEDDSEVVMIPEEREIKIIPA